MLSLEVFHKMVFPNEEKKIYWIFYALIEEFNRQESINDNQDRQLAELKKRVEKLESKDIRTEVDKTIIG